MQFDFNLCGRAERKSLMHYGNAIGGCLIIENILSFILMMLLTSVLSLSLSAFFDCRIESVVENVIFLNTVNALITFVCFFGIFYVMMKITRQPIAQTVGTVSPNNKRYLPFLIAFVLLFMIVGVYFSSFVQVIFEKIFHVVSQQVDYGEVNYDAFTFPFIMLCSAVIPALVEEFAFRGAVLGTLRRFGDIPAIIVSSLMFSLMHGNFQQIPYTFCLALGLGFLRCVTDSIWPCVFCHFFNNMVALIQEMLPDMYGEIFCAIFYLAVIVCGVIGVVVIIKKRLFSELYKPQLVTKTSNCVIRLIFSPLMLIAIIIYLISACQMFDKV